MADAAEARAGSYPPQRHVLRDLRLWTERAASQLRTGLELVPGLLGPAGDVRLGVLATLADVAGGELAVRCARPGWVATSDLVLHRLRRARGAELVARPELVRRTRSKVVLEVALGDGASEPVAVATLGYAVLPAREGQRRMGVGADASRTDFALPGAGLDAPLAERVGARCLDGAAGRFELELVPYVRNSLGALQGGVAALLVELAAEAAGGAALAGPCSARDLALRYLALAREGPVRTAARVLRSDASGTLVRVEARDAAGAATALATLGVARV
jgi:acyl-coenzyme A thioesterase PaaI-like protein